ncbi:unnamed protein product [Rhizoctonia solani]|uniref:Coiled-coil domain-containing protein 130 n=1 Tax=Rhizoctonia solani TaxID=456999 RepID=A0A8H2WIG9_9AGAM|nr:unnamed protein product [Rhizoctonia solani]
MQGFNKYYPPDYDGEKHKSLNSYRGKHALGDRARKLDQGILITRFELPFNIWCGGCDAHIGMGVRYNAEKRKVGSYYSTPIFAFRCKCHLCSHWFEIRTDPQNTRYVVEYGARQKIEEWNPEENGGYAVHENDPSKNAPLDPLQSLEKSTTQEENYQKHARPHLEQLQDLSAARSADPYALSVKLRKNFREGKHTALKIKAEDDAIKDKYGLDPGIKLMDKNDPLLVSEAKAEWQEGQKQREEEEAMRKLHDAQSGPIEFRTRVGSSSSAAGSSSAAASSSRVSIQSPPRKIHSNPRPMHKVHDQPHNSKPILKKDKIAQAAKAKAISTLTSSLVSNSARKADPFTRGGVGVMGRSSTKLPGLARKL